MKNIRDLGKIFGVTLLSLVIYYYTKGILSYSERAGLLILCITAGFWFTQPIPLAATALLVPILQVLLKIQALEPAITPFFDPIILLLLGGFLLAVMVEKHELDKYIAQKIVNSIKASPRYIILVMMLTTSILSMWITNTASTALMIPLVIKLSQGTSEEEGNFAKICVLSIAYSATAGGLGTLLGTSTPPMAASLIDKITGYQISFLEWIFYGFPVTISMVSSNSSILCLNIIFHFL